MNNKNIINQNVLVLHPREYDTKIARLLDNNKVGLKTYRKYNLKTINLATYDSYMFSLDYFEEEDETNLKQFLEKMYQTNKPIVLIYNTYDKIEGKALVYLKNKFNIEFQLVDSSIIENGFNNYHPTSEFDAESIAMHSVNGIKKAIIKNTRNCFIIRIGNITIIHDMSDDHSLREFGKEENKDYSDLWKFLFSSSTMDEPEWTNEIKLLDEIKLEDELLNIDQKITELKIEQKEYMQKIQLIRDYKKVLYTQDEELVDIVKKILTEMLNIDINDIDKKKEDLSLILNDKKVLIEIKGINTAIKRENISQIQRHIFDDAQENNIEDEDISKYYKGVLIINPYIKTPIKERIQKEFYSDIVRKDIIHFDICTIDTVTLLTYFQKYRNDSNSVNIKDIILNNNFNVPNFDIVEKNKKDIPF